MNKHQNSLYPEDYFAERYPKLTAPELSSEDIKKDLEEAERFVKTMFPEEPKNAEE